MSAFHEYLNIDCPWDDKKVVDNLFSNKSIVLLQQDKGRGVVILNKNDYLKKSMEFLDDKQFVKLDSDPTKTFQTKVQNTLRKMKSSFSKQIY